jgi:hypothetical protein
VLAPTYAILYWEYNWFLYGWIVRIRRLRCRICMCLDICTAYCLGRGTLYIGIIFGCPTVHALWSIVGRVERFLRGARVAFLYSHAPSTDEGDALRFSPCHAHFISAVLGPWPT